jgi:plastocyanin
MSRTPFVIRACVAIAVGFLPVAAPAAIYDVQVRNFFFQPVSQTVNVGDTVRWVWIEGSHTATSGTNCVADGLFDAPLDAAHPTFQFTFNSSGSIPYYCTPHCVSDMTGTITVRNPAGVPFSEEIVRGMPILGAFPNPVLAGTELRLKVPRETTGVVEIVDAGGRVVAVLHRGSLAAGAHRFTWDGGADPGGVAPSGVYFARASTSAGNAQTTLLLIR